MNIKLFTLTNKAHRTLRSYCQNFVQKTIEISVQPKLLGCQFTISGRTLACKLLNTRREFLSLQKATIYSQIHYLYAHTSTVILISNVSISKKRGAVIFTIATTTTLKANFLIEQCNLILSNRIIWSNSINCFNHFEEI